MCGFGFDRTMGEDIDFCGIATPDIMLAASRLSAVEMLRSGITLANVAGDAAAFEVARQTPEALGQAGMKAFVQTMLADLFGLVNLSADAQMAGAEILLREYQGKFEAASLAPSVGEALATSLKTMQRPAALVEREADRAHPCLSALADGHFQLAATRPFAARAPQGRWPAQPTVGRVHFLAATHRDIAAVAKAGAGVVHCPSVWMNVNIGRVTGCP
jgi:cytosine/adenosine deaminase-related metal-dependent hydrolase